MRTATGQPSVLLAGSELGELPAPYRRGFPVHRPLQGWAGITALAQPSFAAQRGAERSQVRGDGAESVWRAGSYVSASAGRGGKPVQPAARLHRCLFPNCSRHSMQNTCLCCRSPQPGAEERWAGAAGASAAAKGLGVWEQVRSSPGGERHPRYRRLLTALLAACPPTAPLLHCVPATRSPAPLLPRPRAVSAS